MKIYKEFDLTHFEPWSGAVSTYERIENEGKLDALERILEDLYPDGIDETTLNDILWFEEDWLFEILDIRSESVIRAELADAKEELEELLGMYDSDVEALSEEHPDSTAEEIDALIRELYDRDYKGDIEEAENRIKEIEQELGEL